MVLFNYCRKIAEELGYKIYVYCYLEAGQTADDSDKPLFIEEVRYAKRVNLVSKTCGLIRSCLHKNVPFQSFAYCNRSNSRAVKNYQKEVDAESVIVDMIRLAPLITDAKLSGRIILDLDDLLSKRYQRQLEHIGGNANVLGKLAESEKKLAVFARNPMIKRLILTLESHQVARAEKHYARLSDAVVFVSPVESRKFTDECPNARIFTAPMGVDCEYFAGGITPAKYSQYGVFVGDMQTPANYDSIVAICEQVLPLLPGFLLGVIGNCPPDLKIKLSTCRQIKFLGRVEDLRFEVKKAEVFLAPLSYGTGIKTKLLEAMAMGVPIVTNSIGAEGLEILDGRECFIKESAEEQANAVKRILADEELSKTMSKNAKEYVVANHQWDECVNTFIMIGL